MAKRSNGSSPALFGDLPAVVTAAPEPEKKKRRASTATEAGQAAARLLHLFHDQFVIRHGCKPDIRGAKDTQLLKHLVTVWGEATVRDLILDFLDPRLRDPRVLRTDFSIGAFSTVAQHLMLRRGRPLPDDRTIGNIDAAERAMQPRT